MFYLNRYNQKDSLPRRVFISVTCAQNLSTQFWSWLISGPPVNFVDLRSHLLIIHTLLFSRRYKTLSISLLSNKLHRDLTRARKNRICPSFKRRSATSPKS